MDKALDLLAARWLPLGARRLRPILQVRILPGSSFLAALIMCLTLSEWIRHWIFGCLLAARDAPSGRVVLRPILQVRILPGSSFLAALIMCLTLWPNG